MDKIILTGIELYAHGGVTGAEKVIGQRYRVGVELDVDLSAAGRSDSIEDTIHYGQVHDVVVETVREKRFNLIESVAVRVADTLLQQFPVVSVAVRLEKLLPPINGVVASAGVEIRRP